MTTGSKRRPEQQDFSNSRNILHCGDEISRHTGGTYSHGGMMEYPRFPISELHLAKFPDSMEFESWKVNFKTEVCAKTANPQITMSWITEVERGKSIDESSTSQSILGRNRFPRLWNAGCNDSVCIEEDSQLAHSILEKNMCRRATCSKIRPILTRKTDFVHDLWAFSCTQSLWIGTRTLTLVH